MFLSMSTTPPAHLPHDHSGATAPPTPPAAPKKAIPAFSRVALSPAEAEAVGRRAVAREDDDKKRRVPAAPPLRVAAAGSIAAVERGMRQGWVFRYVGSGVAPRDEAYWTR